jgi:hypothetical protein
MTGPIPTRLFVGLAGLLVFGYGVRADSAPIRWAGIAVVAVAIAMRFLRPPHPRE